MRRRLPTRIWLVPAVCLVLILGLALVYAAHRHTAPATLILTADHELLPANGYAEAQIQLTSTDHRNLDRISWRIDQGRTLAALETPASGPAILHAGVIPGDVDLVATAPGLKPTHLVLHLGLDPTDQFGDGTPDFLRLQDTGDRQAFRRWFTFLAEAPYFQKEDARPAEINDCAALIRFAYREALRHHDGPWASQWHFDHLPATPSIRKYDYPHTALGADLFRVRPGSFAPDDLDNHAFAEFADAETLRRFNAHFVSRDLHAARPGDLIFFRQAGQRMPFHTMIFLGPSHSSEGDGQENAWLIYHTGPTDGRPGELRRVTVSDLMQHPYARWRPLPQNPAFLGVYRWNILREAD